jgi:hypothetical protein
MLSIFQTDVLIAVLVWTVLILIIVVVVRDINIIAISLLILALIMFGCVVANKKPWVREPVIEENEEIFRDISICEYKNMEYFHPKNEDVRARLANRKGLYHVYPARNELSIYDTVHRKQLKTKTIHI